MTLPPPREEPALVRSDAVDGGMPADIAAEEETRPGASEPVTRRVVASAGALLMRSAWERVLGLLATLAIARLLLPSDLGLAALILSATAVATIVVDAGITNSFVRRPGDLTAGEFAAARRAQFALAGAAVVAAGITAAVRPTFGALLLLDSLQLLTDPLVLQPKVMLQRALDFTGLALADGIGVLARAVLSLGIAVVDRGPAALVIGDLAAALVYAAIVLARLAPRAPMPLPGDEASARATMREGAPFQLFALINTVRDLSSSALITGLVGLRALGLFQFAGRVMSPVLVVFSSLSQLSIPVGARVVDGGTHVQQRVRQGYLLSGLTAAVVLAVVATPAHWLVPVVFGQRWDAAVPLIFSMALALVTNGSAITFGVGLLLAANHTRFATMAAAACAVLFLATLAALSSFGGLRALAVAWDVSAAVETAIVVAACRRMLHVRLGLLSIVPIGVFLLAFASGYAVARPLGGAAVPIVAAAGTAAAVSILLGAPFAWRPVAELVRAVRPHRVAGTV